MKKLIPAILIITLACCNEPLNVTTKPDPHTATSGTLGSAKFNNELPKADTSRGSKDSTIKKDR